MTRLRPRKEQIVSLSTADVLCVSRSLLCKIKKTREKKQGKYISDMLLIEREDILLGRNESERS